MFRGGFRCQSVDNTHRYDLIRNKWDRDVARMKEERCGTHGAVAHEQIFVVGASCEVYNETASEWQLIESLKIPRVLCLEAAVGMVCVDDRLYALAIRSIKTLADAL